MFRLLVVSVTLTAGLLTGQRAGEQQDRDAGRAAARRAEQRARDMRSQLFQRNATSGHVKVRVRLKNGTGLTGVLKDRRVVERVEGQRYVPAAASERGAGVRLDYVAGTRGFLFVRKVRSIAADALPRYLQRIRSGRAHVRPSPAECAAVATTASLITGHVWGEVE